MELLAEDFRESDSPRDRRAMQKIELVQRECQRLQDLLDDFLNFAKVRRLRLEPSDLNVQVRAGVGLLPPQGRRKAAIEVVDYLSSDLPTVLLDREAFHGALLNLVLNAQQAMPEGGQLVVRTYGTRRRRGAGPDRHRLRHGRGDAGPRLRRLLSRPSGAARAWGCPPRGRSSRPTAAASAAERAGPRHAVHHPAARARAARRGRRYGRDPVAG